MTARSLVAAAVVVHLFLLIIIILCLLCPHSTAYIRTLFSRSPSCCPVVRPDVCPVPTASRAGRRPKRHAGGRVHSISRTKWNSPQGGQVHYTDDAAGRTSNTAGGL